MIINEHFMLTSFYGAREGTRMRVRVVFSHKFSPLISEAYERSMTPAEYGQWSYDFLAATEGSTSIRLRMESDGMLTGIGHPTEDRWFDPRPAHEIAASTRQVARVEKALLHINLYRAAHALRDLDRTDWTDDDVFIHARELGWSETT